LGPCPTTCVPQNFRCGDAAMKLRQLDPPPNCSPRGLLSTRRHDAAAGPRRPASWAAHHPRTPPTNAAAARPRISRKAIKAHRTAPPFRISGCGWSHHLLHHASGSARRGLGARAARSKVASAASEDLTRGAGTRHTANRNDSPANRRSPFSSRQITARPSQDRRPENVQSRFIGSLAPL